VGSAPDLTQVSWRGDVSTSASSLDSLCGEDRPGGSDSAQLAADVCIPPKVTLNKVSGDEITALNGSYGAARRIREPICAPGTGRAVVEQAGLAGCSASDGCSCSVNASMDSQMHYMGLFPYVPNYPLASYAMVSDTTPALSEGQFVPRFPWLNMTFELCQHCLGRFSAPLARDKPCLGSAQFGVKPRLNWSKGVTRIAVGRQSD